MFEKNATSRAMQVLHVLVYTINKNGGRERTLPCIYIHASMDRSHLTFWKWENYNIKLENSVNLPTR